jgi:hypothetical protein
VSALVRHTYSSDASASLEHARSMTIFATLDSVTRALEATCAGAGVTSARDADANPRQPQPNTATLTRVSATRRSRDIYPFTAPAVMPETIRRWKISASTSGGTTASTPPAFISVGELVWSVTKPAMMIGTVFEFSVEVNSNA